jgi:hypothetical protein
MTKRSSFPLEEQEKIADDLVDDLVMSEQINIQPSVKQSTIKSNTKESLLKMGTQESKKST